MQAEEDNLAGSRKKVSGLESLPKVSEEVRPQPLTEKRTFPVPPFQGNSRKISGNEATGAGNDFRKHPYHLPEIYVKPKLVLQVVGRVDGDRRTPDPTPPLENRRSRIPASYRRFPGRRAASSRTRGPRSRGRRTRVSTRVRCAVGVQRFRALEVTWCASVQNSKTKRGVRLRTKL